MRTIMTVSAADLRTISVREKVPLARLTRSVISGETIIVTSRRGVDPVAFGPDVRAKFVCIVGSSSSEPDRDAVIRKAKIAASSGASVIHNGSSGGDVREIQQRLLDEVNAPIAVCHPIGLMGDACFRKRRFVDLKEGEFIDQFRKDVEQGIEVVLLPLGITRKLLGRLRKSNRLMPCCSKSGSIQRLNMLYLGW